MLSFGCGILSKSLFSIAYFSLSYDLFVDLNIIYDRAEVHISSWNKYYSALVFLWLTIKINRKNAWSPIFLSLNFIQLALVFFFKTNDEILDLVCCLIIYFIASSRFVLHVMGAPLLLMPSQMHYIDSFKTTFDFNRNVESFMTCFWRL